MTKKNENLVDWDWKPDYIKDLEIISNLDQARTLLHEDKNKIISYLIPENEMTIQQLTQVTGINPGTIRRHIEDLIRNKLVFLSKTMRSEYNVKMKFYRTVAKKFKIDIEITGKV